MQRRVVDLASEGTGGARWQLGRVPRQPLSERPEDDRNLAGTWLPVDVPGDVRLSLARAARIPAPESPAAIAAGEWVDEQDWWYRLELPQAEPDVQVVLEMDGVDYYSTVWLDGHRLAYHAGMFSRFIVPLSPWINEAGPHELAVRVWGNNVITRPAGSWRQQLARRAFRRASPGMTFYSPRTTVPKAQYSFGWDFSPRLLSTGIWDEARLVYTRGAYLQDVWAAATPVKERGDGGPAQWRIQLQVRRWQAGPLRARIRILPEFDAPVEEKEAVLDAPASPPGRVEEHVVGLRMEQAERWWPWDQGRQRLYRVEVTLLSEAGIEDSVAVRAGVRSVRRVTLPGGYPWRFLVNGRPLFLRGVNWTPADLLPGSVTAADYRQCLEMARAANANFVRVWGGGVREKRAFWETCDDLGLMAWQEMPLSYDFMDPYPNSPAYLDALGAEAAGIVQGLRNHASLVAWCGGNEISVQRAAPALDRIAAAVREHDGTRPWIPASPGEGDVHQWQVWHSLAPWSLLADERAPFLSEFGLQALPDADTVREMFPDGEPHRLSDPAWLARKAEARKLLHYSRLPDDAPVEQLIATTQAVQAAALQAGIEVCRIRRDGCGGVAFWQFNEPWRAVSWSVVDRAGRPKAAYETVRHSYSPVLIAARFARKVYRCGDLLHLEIWGVNDLPGGVAALAAEAHLDDKPIWRRNGVRIGPGEAVLLGMLSERIARVPRRLRLALLPEAGGETVSQNVYALDVPLPPPAPLPRRLLRWAARRLLGSE